MNLFNRLQNKKIRALQSSREKYLELLASIDPDNATDKEQSQLEAIMNELQIDSQQAADDHRAVRGAYEQITVANQEKAARDVLDALQAKHAKWHVDRLAEIKELDAKSIELNHQVHAARLEVNRSEDAHRSLGKLKIDRPEIFERVMKFK